MVGKEGTTNLSCSATFRKTKKRVPISSLVNSKNQRRHKSLKIPSQERTRRVKKVLLYKYRRKIHVIAIPLNITPLLLKVTSTKLRRYLLLQM